MGEHGPRRARAGDPVDDLCRVCKEVRRHTVIAADAAGHVLRVVCDYCGSQHNYRGRDDDATPSAGTRVPASGARGGLGTFPPVSERERSYSPMPSTSPEDARSTRDLEHLLRRVIREEIGLTPAVPAEKWRGGALVLRPGKAGLQEKSWPIETFFHKVVMLRNRLRVLEQHLNTAEIPVDVKVSLQGYITACYGTLTSFNVLFANDEDRFQGSSSD